MDYSFVVSTNQSEIAFASILNSLAGVSSTLFGGDGKEDFIKDIEQCSGLDRKSERIKAAQDKLWSLYRRSSQYKVHDVKNASSKKRSTFTVEQNYSEYAMSDSSNDYEIVVTDSVGVSASMRNRRVSNE